MSEDLGDYIAGGVQTTNASTQTLDDYQYVYAVRDQWHLVALTYTGLLNATLGQFPILRFYVDGVSTMGNARSDKGTPMRLYAIRGPCSWRYDGLCLLHSNDVASALII